MESSEFSPKELKPKPDLAIAGEQRPTHYGPVEAPRARLATASAYVSFVDYWRLLIRRRRTLLWCALAGLTLAVLVSLVQTPVYRARISLEIQDFNENFLDLQTVDPTNIGGNSLSSDSYFQTQIKLLHSQSLLERVVNKLNLHEAAPQQQGLVSRLRTRITRGSSSPPSTESLVQQAERNLTVRADGQTRLLEVLYESPDPKLAANFANTLASEFSEQSQEMRWASIQRTGQWLTGHLDDMKAKLERSEAQLQEYARSSGLTFTSENDNVQELRLRELQAELSKAEADRVAKEARFQEAKNKSPESLPETLDDPAMREYRVKLTDLQRQSAELTATLTPVHYKVRRVQAQIRELQVAMGKQRHLILRRIGNEYAAASRREALLADAYAKQEKLVADQSAKAIPYDTLKREVDSTRTLYQSMLQRVKEAELAAAMRVSNVVVIDPAKVPLLPYKPNLLMNSALGCFLALFLGLGFVLFRERVDRRIQGPGEAQVYLNVPELGVLPVAEGHARELPGNGKMNPMRLIAPGPAAESTGDSPELATWTSKPSLLAESIRSTLTSILFSSHNGDHPRVVVLTSPCQGDGKTTVACNLSIAMAETGRKVLLIDADLRRPRLDKIFGLGTTIGLTELLDASSGINDLQRITDVTARSAIPGLYLLPSGSGTVQSMNLFYSARMSELLARARAEFDLVFIDAPPMILADARVLGRLSDGVVLVMRAGQTTPEGALFISQRFVEDGTRVLGTVLNQWSPTTSGYGYYGYKHYYERYGSKEK